MFQKAKDIAISRGGRCLTEVYINTDTKMEWECSQGHRWFAKLNHVKDSGSWCKACFKLKQLRPDLLDKAKAYAIDRGGECLSETFETTTVKLQWKCAEGHEWSASYRNIIYFNRWCPQCSGWLPFGLDDAIATAQERGGRCVSTEYVHGSLPLTWECHLGHRWDAPYHALRSSGRWCPVCIGRYDHLDEMRAIAIERGGLCLAAEFINMKTKVLWECREGHQWEATPDSVLNGGHWCSDCPFRNEARVRTLFETITGKRFPKTRNILQYARFELDGYCAELQLAFEYHGAQHYKYIPHFHRGGPSDLLQQQARDQLKLEQCLDAGIALIVIPYDDLDEDALQKELQFLGVAN